MPYLCWDSLGEGRFSIDLRFCIHKLARRLCNMNLHRASLAGIVLSIAASFSAQAGTFVGSLGLNGAGVSQNGADLSVSTTVSTTGAARPYWRKWGF